MRSHLKENKTATVKMAIYLAFLPTVLESETEARNCHEFKASLRYRGAIRLSWGSYAGRLSQGWSKDSEDTNTRFLRSNPQDLHKNPDRMACAHVTPALGRGREETGGSH